MFHDEYSIWTQINRMLWNNTVFTLINESRKYGHRRADGAASINPTIAGFVNQGFVADQLLSIRRLIDDSSRRDQISLVRVLDDIKQNRSVFTRELWVCRDGLPYDYRPAKRRHMHEICRYIDETGEPYFGRVGDIGQRAFDSERMHRTFDKLSNTVPAQRSRDDCLHAHVLDRLKSVLGRCDPLEKYASKFIAHTADAQSRGQLNPTDLNITLSRIDSCHRTLLQVAEYISGPILFYGSHGAVPTPQFDVTQYLDQPWVDPEDRKKLRERWQKRTRAVEKWRENYAKDLGLPP